TQEEACEFFTTHFTLKPAEQDLYRRTLLDGNIQGRSLGINAKTRTPDFFLSPLRIACCTDLHPCISTPSPPPSHPQRSRKPNAGTSFNDPRCASVSIAARCSPSGPSCGTTAAFRPAISRCQTSSASSR